MILYRPGKPAEEAPSVPIVYQVMKSTGHSTMAISEVVMPYIGNAADKSWMAPLLAYRTQMKTALDGVDSPAHPGRLETRGEDDPGQQRGLHGRLPGQGRDHARGAAGLRQEAGPDIKLIINWAASTQVKHWMGVLDGWRASLGPDWDKVYAAPTPSTWRARTTCCSARSPSISRPRRSTTG
jgi:hypothetical protein